MMCAAVCALTTLAILADAVCWEFGSRLRERNGPMMAGFYAPGHPVSIMKIEVRLCRSYDATSSLYASYATPDSKRMLVPPGPPSPPPYVYVINYEQAATTSLLGDRPVQQVSTQYKRLLRSARPFPLSELRELEPRYYAVGDI